MDWGKNKFNQYNEFIYDAKKYGILDKIKTVNYNINNFKFFKILDVFLMTSREDPFSFSKFGSCLFGVQ